MNVNDDLIDKIEDYLRGRLHKNEAVLFEQEIEANAELKELVGIHRFEIEAIEYLVEKDLLDKIRKWDTEPVQEMPAPKGIKWLKWINWSLFVMCLLAGIWYFENRLKTGSDAEKIHEFKEPSTDIIPEIPGNKEETSAPVATEKSDKNTAPNKDTRPSPQANEYLALADAFYQQPEHLVSNLKSPALDVPSTRISRAAQAFKEGQFKTVIALLRNLTPEDEPQQYEMVRELLAHAYFKSGEYPAAAAVFKSIADAKLIANMNDRAEWYLVLSLLPDYKKEKDQVDNWLHKMVDPAMEHGYAGSALELQQQLSKMNNH